MATALAPGLVPAAEPDVAMPSHASAHDAVVSGVRALGLVGWVAVQLAASQPLVAQQLGRHPVATAAVLLYLLHCAAVCWALLRGSTNRTFFWSAGALYLASTLLLLPDRGTMHPINYWAPGYWGMAWAVWSTVVLPRRAYLTLLFAGLGGLALLDAGYTALTARWAW